MGSVPRVPTPSAAGEEMLAAEEAGLTSTLISGRTMAHNPSSATPAGSGTRIDKPSQRGRSGRSSQENRR
jgi:hypothetical protein